MTCKYSSYETLKVLTKFHKNLFIDKSSRTGKRLDGVDLLQWQTFKYLITLGKYVIKIFLFQIQPLGPEINEYKQTISSALWIVQIRYYKKIDEYVIYK